MQSAVWVHDRFEMFEERGSVRRSGVQFPVDTQLMTSVFLLLQRWFPYLPKRPAAFAVVGMAGFFSAVVRAR
jgi:hypothetical protein